MHGRHDIDRGESPLKTNVPSRKPTSDKQLDNSSDDDKMIILHTFWLLMLHLDYLRVFLAKKWTYISKYIPKLLQIFSSSELKDLPLKRSLLFK